MEIHPPAFVPVLPSTWNALPQKNRLLSFKILLQSVLPGGFPQLPCGGRLFILLRHLPDCQPLGSQDRPHPLLSPLCPVVGGDHRRPEGSIW